MKKKIALILTACLMLSACAANAVPNQGGDTAQNASGDTVPNQGTNENANSAESNINDFKDVIGFKEEDVVTKPSQPAVPAVDVIRVNKLEYEYMGEGDYGSGTAGIKINAVNSNDEAIRFPETIEGKPVVYISDELKYSNNVKTLIFPDNVEDYGVIPKSVEYVKLPEGATSIGERAFYDCKSLTSITIPDSVTSIGKEAFCCCGSLTSITIPDSVTSIGSNAFGGCISLTSVTIPNSTTEIGEQVFYNCQSLTSIIIPDGVTSIGDYDFYNCESLTSVTIGNGVTEIGDWAFSDCTSLTSITIPDSITSIGEGAFSLCYSLTSVTIPDSVSKCVFSDTPWYQSQEFVITDGVLEGYNGKGGNVTIPDSVTEIGERAFYHCKSLTSITIPDSVTSIGSYAFYGCESLESIDVPDSVNYIGEYALLVGRAAQVSYKNSTAKSLKQNIGEFLTYADTVGYGMKYSSTASDEIDILVKDGVWSCTALTASNFNGDFKRGSGADGVTSNMNKSDASSIEELLCIELANNYRIENASIHVALCAGHCTAVAYTNEINTPMISGVDYPTITNGEFSETFAWDGETAGLTTSGISVGTSPVVALG